VTTPERLRRRQRFESAGVATVAIGLVLSVIYFAGQDAAQERCLSTFVNTQTETSAIRSGLVERESRATRSVITNALGAQNRRDIVRAYARYDAALKRIDAVREAHPVVPFPEGLCN
jgi:hypothetical protein